MFVDLHFGLALWLILLLILLIQTNAKCYKTNLSTASTTVLHTPKMHKHVTLINTIQVMHWFSLAYFLTDTELEHSTSPRETSTHYDHKEFIISQIYSSAGCLHFIQMSIIMNDITVINSHVISYLMCLAARGIIKIRLQIYLQTRSNFLTSNRWKNYIPKAHLC